MYVQFYYFFTRKQFIKNLHVEGRKIEEPLVARTKSSRNFSIFNIFIIANNQELGSPFHFFGFHNHIASTRIHICHPRQPCWLFLRLFSKQTPPPIPLEYIVMQCTSIDKPIHNYHKNVSIIRISKFSSKSFIYFNSRLHCR